MRSDLFMYFSIKNYVGAQGKSVDRKRSLNAPVVYANGRSKAVTCRALHV